MQAKIILCRKVKILIDKASELSTSRNNSQHHFARSSTKIQRTKTKNHKQQLTICKIWSGHIQNELAEPNYRSSTNWDKWGRESFYLISIRLGSQIKRKLASNSLYFIPKQAINQLSYNWKIWFIRVHRFWWGKTKSDTSWS